ncbi:WG repeat-containing protein [Psychroserpens luteus]|uniref:WG repeat-containing protein n=1 Tax=Psychroserpens luteus TaxID=1434066 RepID=A0ABW5ZS65_9FLAO|nr:WG repeat-containing protein [Psychroserpens luteus]
MKLNFTIAIYLLFTFTLLIAQSNEVEFGNNNTLTDVNISNKNLYVNNLNKNVYSYTNVNKVINLSPLFKTVKLFVDSIDEHTDLKTDGLKKEYSALKNDLERLSNTSSGNHIEQLNKVLKKFLSLYVNALKHGAINLENNAGDAFVLFSDYQNNPSDFKIEEPVEGKLFISNIRRRSLDNKNNIFVYPFMEGKAIIKNKNKYGFIDIYGNIIVDTEYDNVRNFSNGYAVCSTGEFIYILDEYGNKLKNKNKLTVGYEKIYFGDFNEGWFKVEETNTYTDSSRVPKLIFETTIFNYYNEKYTPMNLEKYYKATDFCNGFAYVADSLSFKKINSKGETVKTFDSTIIDVSRNKKCLSIFSFINKFTKSEKKESTQNISYTAAIPYHSDRYDYPEIDVSHPILVDSIIIENDSLTDYSLSQTKLVESSYYPIVYTSITADTPYNQRYNYNDIFSTINNSRVDSGDGYCILKDENEEDLLKPFKNIILLENDFFLYSSGLAQNQEYIVQPKFFENNIYSTNNYYEYMHYITKFNSLGLVKPDSQVIVSENSNYNTLHSYNDKLFVFGKIRFSHRREVNPSNKKGHINFPLIFVKYGLVNSSGVEVLKINYDKITLLSNELVRTQLNGKTETFYIDQYGNAILTKKL